MKAFLTAITFFLTPLVFGQTVLSASILYEKSSNNAVKIDYHLLVPAADSLFSSSDFSSAISCPKTGNSVVLSGISAGSKVKYYLNCSRTKYYWLLHFETTVDLTDPTFNALASCCNLRIDLSAANRSLGITNLNDPMKSFYVYSEFENCDYPVNHSPKSINYMPVIYCVNNPNYNNVGSIDTSDFDSLSYELVDPFFTKDSSLQFNSGYYTGQPVKCYYPGTFAYPYSNPAANPPIGFYLDGMRGEMIFTGTDSMDAGPLTILTKEWRKNLSGIYELIGKTHREIWIEAETCQGNNPPVINPPFNYSTNVGTQLCFDITCDDDVFIPPPPDTAPPPDSVRMSWNREIPGASFTILDPTARLQTARFCWTPTAKDSSSVPYTFIVTARDNNCPVNGLSSKQFTISVKTAGINDPAQKQLNVYPNPGTDIVHLNIQLDELTLLNALGVEVLKAIDVSEIDMSNLPAGIYFLKGSVEGHYYVVRLVVEK